MDTEELASHYEINELERLHSLLVKDYTNNLYYARDRCNWDPEKKPYKAQYEARITANWRAQGHLSRLIAEVKKEIASRR